MKLAYVNSGTSGRIQLELHNVVTDITHLRSDLSSIQTTLDEASGTISHRIHHVTRTHREILTGLERSLLPRNPRAIESRTLEASPGSPAHVLPDHRGSNGSANLILQLTKRGRCPLYCVCVCHQQRSFRTPSFLYRMLGFLFIGYSGSAGLFTECDTEACCTQIKKRWYLYYMFPRWMLDMVILIKLHLQGPEMLIRCLRVRQYATTPVFQSLAQSQDDQVKTLMLIGQASILDVDEFGQSLLHVSVKTWSFLKSQLIRGSNS